MAWSRGEDDSGFAWGPPPGWYHPYGIADEMWYWDGKDWAVFRRQDSAEPPPPFNTEPPLPPFNTEPPPPPFNTEPPAPMKEEPPEPATAQVSPNPRSKSPMSMGAAPVWIVATALVAAGVMGLIFPLDNKNSSKREIGSGPMLPTSSSAAPSLEPSSSPPLVAQTIVPSQSAPSSTRASRVPGSALDQYDPDYGNGFNQRFLNVIRGAGLTVGDDRTVIRMGWEICDLYDKEAAGALPPGGSFLTALTAAEEANLAPSEARTIIRLSVTGICPEHVGLLN